MTYCLGWKTETCAYLIADTATTSLRPLRTLRSSFGEQHVSGATANVQEGALKIISAHRAGITFSGDASLGRAVVETFRMAVKAGVEPRPSLRTAITSTVASTGKLDLSVLCAFVEEGEARLVSFNKDGDQCVVDHASGDLVQLGSLVGNEQTVVCQISDAFLGELSNKMTLEGSALLACALGLCQSYGIHNTLLAHGVGGAFVGAFVDASGFHWQPDIGHLLCNWGDGTSPTQGDGVFPFVRDDVLLIRSLLADGPPRVFVTSLGEPLEAAMERAKEVDRQSLIALDAHQFDYLAFLNTSRPIVAIVEMARRAEHQHVVVHPIPPRTVEGPSYIPISVGPPLASLVAGAPDLIDTLSPDQDSTLGAILHYVNYQHPLFVIRHIGFEVVFFDERGRYVELSEHDLSIYETAKDVAPIFVQGRDDVAFGAAHLLKWYFDSQRKTMDDYIPDEERRAEGSTFTIAFPIHFTEGSFYMNTKDGQRDIRELKLFVEVRWLPYDASRPNVGDLSGFMVHDLTEPTAD